MKNLILYLFWSAVKFIFNLLFDRKLKWVKDSITNLHFAEHKGSVARIWETGTSYEAIILHPGEKLEEKESVKYYDLEFAKRDIENILKEKT